MPAATPCCSCSARSATSAPRRGCSWHCTPGGRTLNQHPHIHCLVSAGGLAADGQWRNIAGDYLLPAAVVKAVYRGKLLANLNAVHRTGKLTAPPEVSGGVEAVLRAAAAKRELQHAGVQLVYCTMDVDTETTGGWLLDSMLEVFDEMQSRQVATDTRRSMERNARQGYFTGGNVPFGYRSVQAEDDPKRRRLEPDPVEAPLARRIFELGLELGAVAIAERLNAEGIRYRRGQKWRKAGVLGVLHSRAAIGQTVFNRKDRKTGRQRPSDQWIIVDSHEPIVDRETWEAVQERMATAADAAEHGSSRSTHVFTGLLRCGECGGRLQAESAKGRSRRYWYYNCRAATVERAHAARRLPADELDAWLIDLICDEVLTFKNLEGVVRELRACVDDWEREHSERRRQRVAELREIESRLGRLYDVLELHGRDAPNLGDLTRRMREHKARQAELEREISAIDAEEPPEVSVSEDEVGALAESLREILRDASPKRARAFFRDFVDRIVVEENQVRIEYRPERLVAVPSKERWLPGTDSNRRPSD